MNSVFLTAPNVSPGCATAGAHSGASQQKISNIWGPLMAIRMQ